MPPLEDGGSSYQLRPINVQRVQHKIYWLENGSCVERSTTNISIYQTDTLIISFKEQKVIPGGWRVLNILTGKHKLRRTYRPTDLKPNKMNTLIIIFKVKEVILGGWRV
jgi:hypothetical protein